MRTKERGDDAEQQVHDYLVGRGLEPLGRNWRRRLGELDLIFRERTPDGPVIVFVEVRYRRHPALGGGLSSVDARKRARLRRAARAWLQCSGDPDQAARIDVIAVGPYETPSAAMTAPSARHAPGHASGEPSARRTSAERLGELDAGLVVPLGRDAEDRPLALVWVVNAVEEDG